jgi:ureidoglycolate lyase
MVGHPLKIEALTKAAFAPFGDVIEIKDATLKIINGGTTERYNDLMKIDVADQNGHAIVSIFRGQPFDFPIEMKMVERHPLGSQAFIPIGKFPFIVVVAEDKNGKPTMPRVFLAEAGQGVNYAKNTWHHPLLSLQNICDFIVIDRSGEGDNLQEFTFENSYFIVQDNED